jgi:hypothetical protein
MENLHATMDNLLRFPGEALRTLTGTPGQQPKLFLRSAASIPDTTLQAADEALEFLAQVKQVHPCPLLIETR